MTEETPPKTAEKPEAARKAAPPRPATKKPRKPKEAKVEPLLTAYFKDGGVSAAAFVKAVSDAKVTRFADDDVFEAVRLREAGDGDHKRLLALATQPSLPLPLAAWLWPTILAVIRGRIPAAFEPYNLEVDASFRRLHHELAGDLTSDIPDVRQPATVMLLLGLAWMATQRNLDLAGALVLLGETFARSDAAIDRHVQMILSSGKLVDIQRAVAVSKLMGKTAREAAAQRDTEKLQRAAVQDQLEETRVQVSEQKRRIAELEAEIAGLKGQVSASRIELDDSRQHWGHDMVEVKTRQASLLREKVVPLLGDAVDALEIEPPQPKIALRRIRTVLASVKETGE